MLSKITSNSELQKLVVSTGNILNVNNQLGRKSSEEALDALQLALASDCSLTKYVEVSAHEGQVLRAAQELNEKITENQRSDLGIGVKLFINNDSPESVNQAVDAALRVLQVEHVDNLVLTYHPKPTEETPTDDTSSNFKWSGKGSDKCWQQLKQLWAQLEEHALQRRIFLLGVCDLDGETLSALHSSARVPPTIAQINLASCCVVPTDLKEFCTQHDIQLLTHSDPQVLLPAESDIIPGYTVDWTVRYQVHVRCRGVIAAKGFIVGASRKQ